MRVATGHSKGPIVRLCGPWGGFAGQCGLAGDGCRVGADMIVQAIRFGPRGGTVWRDDRRHGGRQRAFIETDAVPARGTSPRSARSKAGYADGELTARRWPAVVALGRPSRGSKRINQPRRGEFPT